MEKEKDKKDKTAAVIVEVADAKGDSTAPEKKTDGNVEASKAEVDTTTPSKRAMLLEMMKGRYPDKSFEDDEELYGASADELARYKKDSDALNEMFGKDPRTATLFAAWADGENPMDKLIELFGDDFREALDSDEGKEKFAKAYDVWRQRVEAEQDTEKQAQANLEKSLDDLEAYQKEKGLSNEQAQNIFNGLVKIIEDGFSNVFTKESYEMVSKALNYDKDVEVATREAELKGRNAKIEEKLRKENGGLPPTLNGSGKSIRPNEESKSGLLTPKYIR